MRSSTSRSVTRGRVLAGAVIATVAVAVLAGFLLVRLSAPSPAGVEAGRRGLNVTTLDGAKLTVPDGKPAVLSFITASCGDCVSDIQTLGTLRAEAADRATFLAVSVDPAASSREFADLLGAAGHPDLTVVQDANGALLRGYAVTALGTVVVLGPDGTVAYQEVKPSTEALRAALSRATATSAR